MDKLYNKDNTYHKLSGNSYNQNIIKSRTTKIKNNDDSIQNFKIQASRVDKGNGFQAMAVSPIGNDGKVDNDTVYMIYAGTNPKEEADLGTDMKLALSSVFNNQIKSNPKDVKLYNDYKDLNNKTIDYKYPDNTAKNSQFDEANIWTESVLKEGNYKHVYGSGHSLGGTIAQVMAVMHNFDQTKTFSAPNGYNLLPDNVKRNFDAKKFEKKIVDYTHFTKIERNPMDGYDVSGYVNGDKNKSFTAGIRSTEDFQFDGDITSSNNLEVLYHKNIKSVSEIKKEQSKNEANKN